MESPLSDFVVPMKSFEKILSGSSSFKLFVAGQVDGVNTAPVTRSLMDVLNHPKVSFEPTVELRIDNLGNSFVHNPRLVINGRKNWWNLDSICAEATRGLENDSDRARGVYEFLTQHRVYAEVVSNDPSYELWRETGDPVRMLNVYGFNSCGTSSMNMKWILGRLGIGSRVVNVDYHTVVEAFYNNSWHLFDADENGLFLQNDNKTIASVTDIQHDPALVHQTPVFGMYLTDALRPMVPREASQVYVSRFHVYVPDEPATTGYEDLSMSLDLHPEESIVYRWNDFFKKRPRTPEWGYDKPDLYFNNGVLEYKPNLMSSSNWMNRFVNISNVSSVQQDRLRPNIHATVTNEPSSFDIEFKAPYRFIGATLLMTYSKTNSSSLLKVACTAENPHGGTYPTAEVFNANSFGNGSCIVPLDGNIDFNDKCIYAFVLHFEFQAQDSVTSVGIDSLAVTIDLLMNPGAVPQLESGENSVTYYQEGDGEMSAKFFWNENLEKRKPSAPVCISPQNRTIVKDSQPEFKWRHAESGESGTAAISSFQIQVSDRSDSKWTISSLFDHKVEANKSGLNAIECWKVPYKAKLPQDVLLYWRVRSRSVDSVYSDWTEPSEFRCEYPSSPQELRVSKIDDKNCALSWTAGTGKKPLYYKLYSSNVPGFECYDTSYTILVGNKPPWGMSQIALDTTGYPHYVINPAIFAHARIESPLKDSTSTNEYRICLDVGNKGISSRYFYRVTAVDEFGAESAPSDYIQVFDSPRTVPRVDSVVRNGREPVSLPISRMESWGPFEFNKYDPGYWHQLNVHIDSVYGGPWFAFDKESCLVRLSPELKDGVYSYRVITDSSSVENSVLLTHKNHPPIIVGLSSQIAVVDSLFISEIFTLDPDSLFGDIATCSTIAVPSWLRLDSISHSLVGIPRPGNVGDTVVALKVSDNLGSTSFKSFHLSVLGSITDVTSSSLPLSFCLYQNYPNPFNPTTVLMYTLSCKCKVRLRIFNSLGQLVNDLREDFEEAGYHQVVWSADNLASGVYFARIEASSVQNKSGGFKQTIKMLLIR